MELATVGHDPSYSLAEAGFRTKSFSKTAEAVAPSSTPTPETADSLDSAGSVAAVAASTAEDGSADCRDLCLVCGPSRCAVCEYGACPEWSFPSRRSLAAVSFRGHGQGVARPFLSLSSHTIRGCFSSRTCNGCRLDTCQSPCSARVLPCEYLLLLERNGVRLGEFRTPPPLVVA